ncbi:MAG TPA: alanyl-tRNA editing protein [Treponemataceae bacterium]|jgi:misacylated tRNA(Ala) deacylase|nr:alanyl-tRNA editing protein [Treponemataceae bacterium]HQF72874.1 alanyl-tRNA editing protein [Treponemataceae bacterium]HRR01705.1 alanyl-tRNA editing protein [Treponemataceae bacterium]
MELVYLEDAYVKELETIITSIDPELSAVQFEKSIIYPGGGGQAKDHAVIEIGGRTFDLKDCKKDDRGIWYVLDAIDFNLQDVAVIRLDWERRYNLMRTHTAMHILCGVVWNEYQKKVTGGNMEPLKARMDFEFEGLNDELVREIEHRVNEEIATNHAVHIKQIRGAENIDELLRTKTNLLPPGLTEIRLVEIENLDMQPDGGTHVAGTAEVGEITITGFENKGRINKRIRLEVRNPGQ